jgi:hypothetical protein
MMLIETRAFFRSLVVSTKVTETIPDNRGSFRSREMSWASSWRNSSLTFSLRLVIVQVKHKAGTWVDPIHEARSVAGPE